MEEFKAIRSDLCSRKRCASYPFLEFVKLQLQYRIDYKNCSRVIRIEELLRTPPGNFSLRPPKTDGEEK